jgi:phospholipase/lecithinase/hemolysin
MSRVDELEETYNGLNMTDTASVDTLLSNEVVELSIADNEEILLHFQNVKNANDNSERAIINFHVVLSNLEKKLASIEIFNSRLKVIANQQYLFLKYYVPSTLNEFMNKLLSSKNGVDFLKKFRLVFSTDCLFPLSYNHSRF